MGALPFVFLLRVHLAEGFMPDLPSYIGAEGGIYGHWPGRPYTMASYFLTTLVGGWYLWAFPWLIHAWWNFRRRLRTEQGAGVAAAAQVPSPLPHMSEVASSWRSTARRWAASRFSLGLQIFTIVFCAVSLVWLFTVREVFAQGSLPSFPDDGLLMLPLDPPGAMAILFVLVFFGGFALGMLPAMLVHCWQLRRALQRTAAVLPGTKA